MTAQEQTGRFVSIMGGNVKHDANGNINLISLAGTQITDTGLALVDARVLHGLETLYLAGTQITDSGLAQMQDARHLTALGLAGTQIVGTGLEYLQQSNLKVLFLAGCTQLADEALTSLRKLKRLRRLFLAGCNQLTGNILQHLVVMLDLEVLCLDGMQINDDHLMPLARLKKLKSLSLTGTQVTGAGLLHLEKLEHLSLLGLNSTAVTNACASNVLPVLKQLNVLSLARTRLNDESIAALKRHLPSVEIIQ